MVRNAYSDIEHMFHLYLAHKVRLGLHFILRIGGQKPSLCMGVIKSAIGHVTLEFLWGESRVGATPISFSEKGCSQPVFCLQIKCPLHMLMSLVQPSLVIFKFPFPVLYACSTFAVIIIGGREVIPGTMRK